MVGLTIVVIALSIALLVLVALFLRQRRRIRKLAEQAEDFLVGNGAPLEFSVQEDSLAPLHNAIAELQNRLLLAKERQAEKCRRTSDLTADISHQLKTPLASLRLYCEMDESFHLSQQLTQIERMERLIQSLLRLERLCADGYEFTYDEQEVASIIRSCWAGLSATFPACTVEVIGNAIIRCDEKWLSEAFTNLLKNACEHMPEGGTVHVRMETTEAAFFCTVEDEGGGASGKDLPHLFERFYRAEGSPSSQRRRHWPCHRAGDHLAASWHDQCREHRKGTQNDNLHSADEDDQNIFLRGHCTCSVPLYLFQPYEIVR